MGTNTMVAAVGLVLGPVLGGVLVSISWQWVFWFNVPFALAGALWGWLVLHELAKPDEQRGLDLLGTVTFVIGPDRARARHLQGRHLGLGRPGGHRQPRGRRRPAAAVRAHRARVRAPMLDLSIFKNRLFAAATGAAFINGLSRFALMFVFVFYFQGAQGDDPITAGIKLAPLAVGMLISSPLAGIWADRRGSRALAALGMLVSAVGLAAHDDAAGRHAVLAERLWLLRRRHRLGHVQLAQHRRDDGHGARPSAAASPPARG